MLWIAAIAAAIVLIGLASPIKRLRAPHRSALFPPTGRIIPKLTAFASMRETGPQGAPRHAARQRQLKPARTLGAAGWQVFAAPASSLTTAPMGLFTRQTRCARTLASRMMRRARAVEQTPGPALGVDHSLGVASRCGLRSIIPHLVQLTSFLIAHPACCPYPRQTRVVGASFRDFPIAAISSATFSHSVAQPPLGLACQFLARAPVPVNYLEGPACQSLSRAHKPARSMSAPVSDSAHSSRMPSYSQYRDHAAGKRPHRRSQAPRPRAGGMPPPQGTRNRMTPGTYRTATDRRRSPHSACQRG